MIAELARCVNASQGCAHALLQFGSGAQCIGRVIIAARGFVKFSSAFIALVFREPGFFQCAVVGELFLSPRRVLGGQGRALDKANNFVPGDWMGFQWSFIRGLLLLESGAFGTVAQDDLVHVSRHGAQDDGLRRGCQQGSFVD